MRPRHKIPAVVTAMDLNGLGVARTLGRNGVRVIGIHRNDTHIEVRTRYLRELWLRSPGPKGLLNLLRDRAKRFTNRPVLIPVTDESVEVIARHRDELLNHYRIGMPAGEVVLALLDRGGIRAAAESLDFPLPPTWFVAGEEEVRAVAARCRFPCIMKPATKSTGYARGGHAKAFVLDDERALLATYAKVAVDEPRMVIQQFIPGGDDEVYFTLQYCNRESEALASFTGRKLRQWLPRSGGTASCTPAHVPELEELTRSFFKRSGMQGLCSMEYKRDARDGKFYMIGPTVCRTDWQSAVADANGVPIPYLAYCDLAGEPLPQWRQTRLKWRWVHWDADRRAAEHYREQGKLGRLAWLWSIRWPVRWAYWARDDWRPSLAIVSAFLGRARRRLGRLLSRKARPAS